MMLREIRGWLLWPLWELFIVASDFEPTLPLPSCSLYRLMVHGVTHIYTVCIYICVCVCVCTVGVALLTLLERRVSCSIHICRGPNKMGFFSIVEILLGYFLRRSIFLLPLIIWLTILLQFFVNAFLCWFGYWFFICVCVRARIYTHIIYIYIYIYIYRYRLLCRSDWPRGLRCRSAAARLLRLWFRIGPRAWMSVISVVCYQVEVSATGWSLVQRIPTGYGVSLCVI